MHAKIGRELLHGHHTGQIVFRFCCHFVSHASALDTAPLRSRITELLISCCTGCYLKPALTASDIRRTVCAGQERPQGTPITLSTVAAVHVASGRNTVRKPIHLAYRSPCGA